jgi:hypothetical protein
MNVLPVATANGRNHIGTIAGKIERRDRGDDAERLAHDVAIDAVRDVFEAEPLHQRRRPARDFHALDAAAHAAARLIERLAVLGGHRDRELLELLLEQRLEPVQDLRAGVDRRVAPGRERGGSRLHGGLDVLARRKGRPPDEVTDRGVVYIEKIGGPGLHPAAADEVVERDDV